MGVFAFVNVGVIFGTFAWMLFVCCLLGSLWGGGGGVVVGQSGHVRS